MKRVLSISITTLLAAVLFACADEPAISAVDATPAQSQIQTDTPDEVIVDEIKVPITELIVSSEEDLPDPAELKNMTSLRLIDLTALPYTSYEKITSLFQNCSPGVRIVWNQMLTDGIFRSDSLSLTLPNATAEDIRLLDAFSGLAYVDASGSKAFEALYAYRQSHPSVEVHYTLTLGDTVVSDGDESIVVPEGIDAQQLISDLKAFDHIKEIDLRECGWDDDAVQQFLNAYPSLTVYRLISIGDQLIDSEAEMLDLRAFSGWSADQLIRVLNGFSGLKQIALPSDLSDADIDRIKDAFPQLSVIGPVTAFGRTFDGAAEEIDLSKIKMRDTEEVETVIQQLPLLRKLVMCECELTDEQMEQLCDTHPNIKFVWTVVIGKRKLRTDAIGFSTKNPSKYTNPNATDKYNESVKKAIRLHEGDIAALKYCTDLEALDLGHNYLTNNDLAVISGLTKLRILILADNKITDISVLTSLKDLEYIELFMNRIPDLSPLCELPKLVDVNVCNTGVSDLTPLFQLKSVKRLWYAMNPFNREQAKQLKESLPDCQCNYTTQNETAEGWREDPRYQWMRSFFADP